MPVAGVYDIENNRVSEIELNDAVFGAEVNQDVIYEVVRMQMAARRAGTASTKGRSDVSGGGKKPWRQKKTGRARHGSTRSPLWTGGGVTHAPKPRDYSQKVNKKVRRLAIRSALSLKVRDELMTVVQSFDLSKPSTKEMIAFFSAVNARKPLIVLPESNETVAKSARNVPGAKVINMGNINVYDLLNAGTLVLTPEVVSRLEEVYVG